MSDTDVTDADESESDLTESESDRQETILQQIAELESELATTQTMNNKQTTWNTSIVINSHLANMQISSCTF